MGTFVTQDADATRLSPRRESSSPKASEAHLSDAPLAIAARQLVQINLQFLALSAIDGGPSDALGARIRSMSAVQRLAMADCRFSLFTLAFSNRRCWQPLFNRAADELAPAATDACGKSRAEFVASAVFFAWHLVQSDLLAAKFLLSVDDEVAAALQHIPIARLLTLSLGACSWLAPRWLDHSVFWPALVRHSCEATPGGLLATKLLGRQLLAAESLDLRRLSRAIVEEPARSRARRSRSRTALTAAGS